MNSHIDESSAGVDHATDEAALALKRSRDDQCTAQTIDHALRLMGKSDAYHAALLLRARGVPLDLTLRVLLQPGQRRTAP
jgi:hypothetical protein